MKVLITGADGQLGSELKRALASGKTEIGTVPACFLGCNVLAAGRAGVDVSDGQAVAKYVRDNAPDILINCAAMTNVDACESDRQAALRANALGPRNLALAARDMGAKLIHISTDYVFSGTGTEPYCEWDEPNPQTVYGKSKLLGERYVQVLHHKTTIVRTAWLYGYEGHNFVKTIVKAAREKGQLRVVGDQRGNPTHAGDLAHHILKLAAAEEYGLYHCTGDGECSWYDFACEIVRLAQIPCDVQPCTTAEYPRPAPRPAFSSLRNLALSCTVGDEMRPWRDALASFLTNWEGDAQ